MARCQSTADDEEGVDVVKLGSQQRRVLNALNNGPGEIDFSTHLNYVLDLGTQLQWRDERDQFRFISERRAYQIAERLQELGLVEIDLTHYEVRVVDWEAQ